MSLPPFAVPSALNRRQILTGAGLAAAALVAGRPGSAAAQTPAKFTTANGWVPNAQYAGYWVALEKGYFKEEGLDGSWLAGGPNAPPALVVLASGGADLAHGQWLPMLDARARGNDFVMVGANFPVTPNGFLSMAKKPVKSIKDLVGARILGQVESDKIIIETMFKLAGLPVNYTFVKTGFSPEALVAGDGDAYVSFLTNQPITLEQMGLKPNVDFFGVSFLDFGYRVPATTFVVSRATLDKRRAELVRYLRALARGWIENEKDPAFGAKLAVEKYGKDLGLNIQQATRQNQLQIPMTRDAQGRMFWVDPAEVKTTMYEIARQAGRTNLPDDVTQVCDMGPLKEALASL